jgi:predicted nucleic acid-binding protein
MSSSAVRHPILVDTSALVAIANTDLWTEIRNQLTFTTTNVCEHELRRHVEENSEYARKGSREYQLRRGSQKALDALEDDNTPFTSVTCIPRPHGADAGEESLRREIAQNTEAYRVVVVMDDGGRRSIRRTLEREAVSKPVVAPTYPFYLLYDRGVITREEFCEACGEMLNNEGWTGYKAVKAAWEEIPVDCSDVLDDELLPP